jgi:hypothetical protein
VSYRLPTGEIEFPGEPKMDKEMQSKSTVIHKAENGCLLFAVPVISIPPSLRSGNIFAEAIQGLLEKARRARLEKRLDRFLKHAQAAENKEDPFRAARAFTLALYCDGMLHPDVTDVWGYVRGAMPVY